MWGNEGVVMQSRSYHRTLQVGTSPERRGIQNPEAGCKQRASVVGWQTHKRSRETIARGTYNHFLRFTFSSLPNHFNRFTLPGLSDLGSSRYLFPLL